MTAEVNTPSEDYRKVAPMWELPRTLMGGTKAMRAAGIKYLPQEAAESADAYKARLCRSTLFNGFRKTVNDMTGKVFRKEIVLGDDVPEQIKTYAENIDNAGRHLNVFAKDVFKDGMQTGIGYILTEMPPPLAAGTGRNGEVTKADELAANRRPYLCYIKRDDVLGWKSQIVNGQPVLTQFRIKECATIDDGAFGTKEVPQVRVLYPGRWEIWREATEGTEKGKWVKVDAGTTTLTYIPIAPVYINRTAFMEGEPPLEDLADLNVAHWQSQSDQRNILHVARVPILFGAGFQEDDKIEIGASRMVRSSTVGTTLEYVEHSGAAIGAGDKDLENLKIDMQTQGLQLLMPQPGGKSATGEIHDDEKENSQLAMMAMSLQDALEWSLGFMADYLGLGKDKGGSLTVNKDFGISAAAAANAPQVIASYNAGLIDRETAIKELQRLELISSDETAEDIAQKAEDEAASLGENIPPGQGLPLGN
jgi:hypothetical protein